MGYHSEIELIYSDTNETLGAGLSVTVNEKEMGWITAEHPQTYSVNMGLR